MTERTLEDYKKTIRPLLTDARYHHSVCVAQEAVRLAKKYGADVQKAETAGILHDILKDTAEEKQLKIILDFGIIMNNVELQNKKLWHAIGGAAYLEGTLGITDAEILSAIRWHTSGRKDMSLLEKVVFIADYISADRDYYGVDEMRAKADESLDAAIVEGVAFTTCELIQARKPVASCMLDAYNDALMAVQHG